MSNILKDITNTVLEGLAKYVNLEFKCIRCDTEYTDHDRCSDAEYWKWLKGQPRRSGSTWRSLAGCKNCPNNTFIITKITPSENQHE